MIVTELRIGNYIDAILQGKITRVEYIDSRDGIIGSSDFSDRPIEDFLPIELTEEWLLKLGFDKKEDGSVSCQYHIGNNPLTHDYVVSLVWLKRLPNYELEGFPFYRNGHHTIKNVHQLQNLYFALTGQELTIKE